MTPRRCVVDTNVLATANGANEPAGLDCRVACADALREIMVDGHLFLDRGDLILDEYLKAVGAGQPEPGGAFVKWVLQNQWAPNRVTRVPITPRPAGSGRTGFQELPDPPRGTRYDPADEKFLAVAAACPEHPPVLQAFDSKWWGWQGALKASGVTLHFLCPGQIQAKYEEKFG